ncbi:hypothetical protein [Gimesia maris]|uniref:hypothetical protein n=1 Tax=Gimesia maris TaxID=122 RepID=UPI0001543EDA|nr:hypothetical protein [Gimesia maris]EDL56547.1 hypothetical protein PM8797T_01004 [Gimesia maris DSM 8797]
MKVNVHGSSDIHFIRTGLSGRDGYCAVHSFSHGIRSHPDARAELVVHSLRGPTYAALFLVIPNLVLQGFYFWCLLALFVFDILISIVDFALERESRRLLGGLPSGEYVLHIIIAMLFGGLVTAVCLEAAAWRNEPTQIIYAPAAVPDVLRLVMAVMALLVLFSGIQDAIAARKLYAVPLRGDHSKK